LKKIVVIHEDIFQVKRGKIDLLHFHYENFNMNDNETINDMLTRFIKITDDLSSLGDSIDNDQKVRKVICALSQSWKVKSITLK